MNSPLHDLATYILIQSGFAVKDGGFIYDTRTGEFLQYNGKMIYYNPEDTSGNVDVIPLDVSKSSKILDIIFSEYAKHMAIEEDVCIDMWFITRQPGPACTLSKLNVRLTDNGVPQNIETGLYALDALAYAEALGRINGINDFSDLRKIDAAIIGGGAIVRKK